MLALLAGWPAAAQELAAAEALFNTGVTDLEAGKYDTACPALAESQRLDPRPGTLFALADCQDRTGKIASAATLYDDYLLATDQLKPMQRLRHDKRISVAKARRAELASQIPELTLVSPPSVPAGVRITRDGADVSPAELGVALPLDPGEHVITFRLDDGPVVEERISLAAGEKTTLAIDLRRAEKKPERPAVASAPRGGFARAPQGEEKLSGRRVGALVAGSVGVAGLALGGVTGLMTLAKKPIIEEHCRGKICDTKGKAAADATRLPGLLSSIGFGIGVAGAVAGLVLWSTEPSGPTGTGRVGRRVQATVDAGPEGAALGLKGVW
ncbi:hypothetical protein [Sorangium sp. So ce362]|uniref:hypothetical protein n=1 Tax=Sorangium sp. So ce362 TaxID=3133303 RepID=UPI003F5E1B5A